MTLVVTLIATLVAARLTARLSVSLAENARLVGETAGRGHPAPEIFFVRHTAVVLW